MSTQVKSPNIIESIDEKIFMNYEKLINKSIIHDENGSFCKG